MGFYLLNKFKRNEYPLKKNFEYFIFLKEVGNNIKTNLKLYLRFRDCKIGERFIEDFVCEECPSKSYLFVRNFEKITELCKDCSKMNFNCFGGFKLTPIKGFWRLNKKSTSFFKCPNPNACLGDPRNFSLSEFYPHFANGICEDGYTSIKCNVCAENWGFAVKNICLKV